MIAEPELWRCASCGKVVGAVPVDGSGKPEPQKCETCITAANNHTFAGSVLERWRAGRPERVKLSDSDKRKCAILRALRHYLPSVRSDDEREVVREIVRVLEPQIERLRRRAERGLLP